MKKRSILSTLLSILLGILAAGVIICIAGFFLLKFWLIPKYTEKLAESGNSELVEIIENNNNLGAFATLGSLLADKDVLNLISNLDRDSATAVLEVLDTLDKEYAEQGAIVSTDDTWQVPDYIPPLVSKPQQSTSSLATPTPEPQPNSSEPVTPSGDTAYDRISSVASAQDMADGLKIIAKLDMGYVSSLVSGGLTSSEKSELKAYVTSVLSGAEISRALSLYRQYSKYL